MKLPLPWLYKEHKEKGPISKLSFYTVQMFYFNFVNTQTHLTSQNLEQVP